MPATRRSATATELLDQLLNLRRDVLTGGRQRFEQWKPRIEQRPFLISGLNLAYYLALREHDLRGIQSVLPALGLTSLNGSEAQVLQTLDATISRLAQSMAIQHAELPAPPSLAQFYRGRRMLERNSLRVMGTPNPKRRTRIMVTLPTEAAGDNAFLIEILRSGADWVRLNCAHDDPELWKETIRSVRAAERATGKHCGIHMDLSGPRVRVGAVMAPERGNGKSKKLKEGATLLLTEAPPVQSSTYPFQAHCLIPEALVKVKPGHRVFLDDGQVELRVEQRVGDNVELRVLRTSPKGYRLKPEKGLNFPDTSLTIPALSDKDREDLAFVVEYADAVGYSFVQTADDIREIQSVIEVLTAKKKRSRPLSIIGKVETETAVRNLPEIIVEAAGKNPFGAMIARGDLAVELGFARAAEMQEEILWVCEAAHVPVIWATQVLESLVKTGMPTRAEMTDAAMGDRAECIMLNKGPNIVEAIEVLGGLLMRMEGHQTKRRPQMRALKSWSGIR